MRISELSATTGVSIPVLKLYIRQGLLSRGVATASTQATYDQGHVDRVRLIEALRSVQDMPLAKIHDVLAVIDEPPADILTATGRAVAALPPYVNEVAGGLDATRQVVEGIGLGFLPDFPATTQLAAALEALDAAGLPADVETIRRYAAPLWQATRAELAPMSTMEAADAVAYAVLGTALYEPVILALRRLFHHALLTHDGEFAPDSGAGQAPDQ